MNSNIVQIQPKQTRDTYRKHSIVLTFIPSTHEWEWKVEHVQRFWVKGKAKTHGAAVREAHRAIDKLEEP